MIKKRRLSASRETMTLPDERYRSIKMAHTLLVDLATGRIPRVPSVVKQQAAAVLRHYPTEYDLKLLSEAAPHVVQERMEPLYKMVLSRSLQETIAADHGIDISEGGDLD